MSTSRSATLPADELPEGEEQAPAGARTMAVVRWALVALMAVAAVGAWTWFTASSGVLSTAEARFHCPMHPSVVMDHKGECPICGMDLVPVSGEPGRPGAKAAVAMPAAAPGAAKDAGPGSASRFTCPMHPAFVTADPKARCPECGMKLVPQEPAAGEDGDGVPGLAEVELTVDRIQLAGLETTVAARAPLGATLRTVGFVSPAEGAVTAVNARFTGWIEDVRAETGARVEKGQVLATIYGPETEQTQQVFLNAYRLSSSYQGQSEGVPGDLDEKQLKVAQDARQRLRLAGVADQDIDQLLKTGAPLKMLTIRAPAAGYVARRSVVRGAYVTPGTELFLLTDLSTVWVLADVYESELARVQVGQKATLALDAWPGERFEGRVDFLAPALTPGSRTLQARLAFKNPGLKLRPGMYGNVTLELPHTDAVVVPRDAVVDTGDVQYVFVSRGQGRFAPRRVRTGFGGDGRVAVLEGLREGERVVSAATFLLDSESRLRAAVDGPPAAQAAAPMPAGPSTPGGAGAPAHPQGHQGHSAP